VSWAWGFASPPARPFFRWDWVWDHLDEIGERMVEHLVLTSVAVGIGLAISVTLAIVGLRFPRSYPPITVVTGALYAIPSIALFAFLIPITGLTMLTAQIGLVSYTLLILVRNIVAGIEGVDPAVKEAAVGMGYSKRRMLLEIEIPLALPVIMAGIRVAAVTTVGLVTITALVGMGGLGFFILRGLGRFFETEIILGTVLSVALAAAIDLLFVATERILAPWAKRRGVIAT
jgi:osmoprotectant transport system permease protein